MADAGKGGPKLPGKYSTFPSRSGKIPTYEYKCTECDYVHDEFHDMNRRPRIKCPKCGAKCKKIISAGQRPIFKGSGFYETEYRKKDQTNKRVRDAIKKEAPDDQLAEGGVNRDDL